MGRLQGLLLGCSLLICDAGPAPGADSLRVLSSHAPRDTAAAISLRPGPLATDPLGRVWMLDTSRGRVARLGEDGVGTSVPLITSRDGRRPAPIDIAASGTYLYALDSAGGTITVIDLDGQVRERIDLAAGLLSAEAEGFFPSRLLVGRSGDLWLLESRLGGILHFDRRMRFLDRPLDGLAGEHRPARIADWALTSDDGLLLLDAERGRLIPLDPLGAQLPPEDLGGAVNGSPSLAVDEEDRRFVLDAGGRLRILNPGGSMAAELVLVPPPGSGGVRMLAGRGGILCLADTGHGRIDRWRIDGLRPADAPR